MDRQTIMEINVDDFNYNYKILNRLALSKGKKVLPVLKANGYGTYVNKCPELISQFDIIGLAMCLEAIELRKNGYSNDILILNEPYKEDIDNIIKYNLIVGVCSTEFINTIGTLNKTVKIFIEIETGMGRTGVKLKDLSQFVKLIKKYQNIEVIGCYTHF